MDPRTGLLVGLLAVLSAAAVAGLEAGPPGLGPGAAGWTPDVAAAWGSPAGEAALALGALVQEADFDAVWDSLQGAVRPAPLRAAVAEAMEAKGGRAPQVDGAPAEATLRGALAAVRLYEISRLRDDADAARELAGRARQASPGEPWAHLAVALALARGPEVLAPADTGLLDRVVVGRALRRTLGRDDRAGAREAALAAVALDPALPVAGEVLGELALHGLAPAALAEARRVLEAAEAAGRGTAASAAVLGGVLTALGEGARGAAVAAAGMERGGRGVAEAAYARALALLSLSDSAAAGLTAWRASVAVADSAGLARLWEDIHPAAGPWDAERWAGGASVARRELLLDFWEERAALAGVGEGDRVAEHYRRLDTARMRFPRRTLFGAPPANALLLRPRQALPERVDDRGTLYIRHGEPDTIVRTFAGPGGYESESWGYRRPTGRWDLFNFFRYDAPMAGGSHDFVLIDNVPCDGRWLGERTPFEPRFGRLAASCDALAALEVSAALRETAFAALEGDSHRPSFTRDLALAWDVATFRGADGRTDVVAAVAVPRAGIGAALELSLILVDTVSGGVTRVDTTVATRAAGGAAITEPARSGMLRAHIQVAAPPAVAAVQRIVARGGADAGHGAMAGGPVVLRDYTGDTLMVSDILLAEPDAPGPFIRGEARLALVPGQRFAPRSGASAFRLFYEIYNVAPGQPYETRVEVERVGQGVRHALRGLFGGNRPVTLRLDGVAAPDADGVVRELRRVAMALEPGRYRLRVSVRAGAEGVERVRERTFTVPEEGR